jgi:hypothetical protein
MCYDWNVEWLLHETGMSTSVKVNVKFILEQTVKTQVC